MGFSGISLKKALLLLVVLAAFLALAEPAQAQSTCDSLHTTNACSGSDSRCTSGTSSILVPCGQNGCDWFWTGLCNKPTPLLVSIDYKPEINLGETVTVTIKYRNQGKYSPNSFISPSFDNNWDILEYSGDLPNRALYPKGYKWLWTKYDTGESTKEAEYPLIDFWGSWPAGQTKTFTIKLKPKAAGTSFVAVRSALCENGNSLSCRRNPESPQYTGYRDQQSWGVYPVIINVKPRPTPCTGSYKCYDQFTRRYQSSGCSWSADYIDCEYGCSNGYCNGRPTCNQPRSLACGTGCQTCPEGYEPKCENRVGSCTRVCNQQTSCKGQELWQTNKNCQETLLENCYGGCSNGKCNSKPPPKLKLNRIDYPAETGQNKPIGVYIEYTNIGDDASSSFVSPSFDSNFEILNYGGDLPIDGIYRPGSLIWNSNNQQFPASHTLIDFKGRWAHGQTKGFWFTIKPKSSGSLWFKVRGVLIDGNNNYFRDPRSGQTDQQGHDAYTQIISVKRPDIKIESISLDSATYKKCSIENQNWSCSDFTEQNPTEIPGGSKIKLTLKLSENNFRVDTWNQFSGWKTYTENPITQEIQIPKDANLNSIAAKVVDKNNCDLLSCKQATTSIPIKITPNKNPEIREIKMCYEVPQDDGACPQPVPSQMQTPGGKKILEFSPISKGRPVALYFRLHNLENRGTASSYTILELDRLTLSKHNKLTNSIQASRETNSPEYPGYIPVIWVFNSSDPGTHQISIKTTDLQDGDSSESPLDKNGIPIDIQIGISERKLGETKWPIEIKGGYAENLKTSISGLDDLEGELINNIIPSLTGQQDKDDALAQLSRITVLQSLLKSRQASIVNSGTFEPIGDWATRVSQAATGFFSWVGGILKGIDETIRNFENDPIGSLQGAWNWAVNNPHQAIDLAIMAATIAVIAASIILTGGFGAAFVIPAMIALDIATVANILTKVIISKQPLDAWDIVTIGLVGVANAGVIAKGIKSGIGNLALEGFAGRLGDRIGLIGKDAAAVGKIQKGVGRLAEKTDKGVYGEALKNYDPTKLSWFNKLSDPVKNRMKLFFERTGGLSRDKLEILGDIIKNTDESRVLAYLDKADNAGISGPSLKSLINLRSEGFTFREIESLLDLPPVASRIQIGPTEYLMTISAKQGRHLLELKEEILATSRKLPDVDVKKIVYDERIVKEGAASSGYDYLVLSSKVSKEELAKRSSILHEFVHIKINKARFSTAEEYTKNTKQYYEKTWFDEAEVNFLMKSYDSNAFAPRVRQLAEEIETKIRPLVTSELRDLPPKALEAITSTKQLAHIAGDQISFKKLEQIEQTVINSGRTTPNKISDLNDFFDNLFNNKMKNGKILDQRDSEKEILDLFKIIPEVRT